MKNFKLAFQTLVFVLAVNAQASSNGPDLVKELHSGELQGDGSDYTSTSGLNADQEVLETLRYNNMVSTVGMPDAQDDKNDNPGYTGYGPAELIQQSLEQVGEFRNTQFSFTMDWGPAIETLHESAKNWVTKKEGSVLEIMPRVLLNRCIDFFELTFPLAGSNTDEVRRIYSNYWSKCYTNAIAYANNSLVVSNSSSFAGLPKKVAAYAASYSQVVVIPDMHQISQAQFASEQANFFYDYSASKTIAEEAQAVAMIRLVSYLGHDHVTALNHKEPLMKQTLTDVSMIQQSPTYRDIMAGLETGLPFDNALKAKVALLRGKVLTLLKQKLPTRLAGMGLGQ